MNASVASCRLRAASEDCLAARNRQLATTPTMPSASRDIVVSNKLGLHARPAMQFVDLANQFSSSVTVFKGGDEPAETGQPKTGHERRPAWEEMICYG